MITSNNHQNKNEMSKKRKKQTTQTRRTMADSVPYVCDFMDRVADSIKGLLEADATELVARMKGCTRGRCYISGAIAHHDLKERMDTFERAAIVLEKSGYIPVNPFNNGVPQSEHWTKHMRADIGLLLGCDYIYMLKGWELSKGCKLELDVASSCGIKVLFED